MNDPLMCPPKYMIFRPPLLACHKITKYSFVWKCYTDPNPIPPQILNIISERPHNELSTFSLLLIVLF